VAWAIFGEASGIDGAAAIRAGSDKTVAEVDLSVGDTRFTVTRTLARASNDRAKGRHTLDVSMDGTPTVSADLTRRLSEVATLPQDVLPQLMFVPEMRLTHEGELFADVQDHLAALLGIDDLRQARRAADDVARSAGRQLREAKEIVRVSAATVETATARVGRLTDELRSLDDAIATDMSARSGIDATLRRLD
jgi:DNA repair exonuclease SbcCD ATPase subunit